ncbi:hypothetical protein ACFU3E_21145 [Streptomyces sp. NPDC057424]|uniref:hypothetical protein n=1 Tax=Streptomyces sp. NPDC057424 TaxID=3346127 RepID=UPI003675E71B
MRTTHSAAHGRRPSEVLPGRRFHRRPPDRLRQRPRREAGDDTAAPLIAGDPRQEPVGDVLRGGDGLRRDRPFPLPDGRLHDPSQRVVRTCRDPHRTMVAVTL